jgi:2-polyprenyl-6-methoxyphenol hydroxylase-like FAD-dependent oxidoreductase
VLGGGVCGQATGVLLARDGHDVEVWERDPEPAPSSLEEAWVSWDRRVVKQFRQEPFATTQDDESPRLAGPNRAELLALLA